MSKWATIGLVAVLAVVSPASAQYIGIFLDANASSCAAEVGPYPRVDLHLIAVLGGDVTSIWGAEFRVAGAPESWTPQNVLWVPDVNAPLGGGNPIFPGSVYPNGGVSVGTIECQTSNQVELGRIVLLGPPTGDNVRLWVTTTGIWENVPCPAMLRCSPFNAYVCVGGGEIVLNGPAPKSCELAVDSRTWTGVKALYKD